MTPPSALEVATTLCDDLTERHLAGRPQPWAWGPAVLGFALTELDEIAEPRDGRPRYEAWERAWVDHWVQHPPRIDQSDRAAPGLVTDVLAERTRNRDYTAITDRVVRYVRHEPRLAGGVTNHLGPSRIGRLYPKSVWVDSLMMFGVFAARWGRRHGDAHMVDLAARQPRAYGELLQDPNGLWHHAWWARTGQPHPRGVHWGRGNGWVMASLPMILEAVGLDHPEADGIVDRLQRTSAALSPLQGRDGSFRTLLTEASYRELSATALVASGWYHGVRLGVLPEHRRDAAERALGVVTAAVRQRRGVWELPEISGPTIPLHVLGKQGYLVVPRGVNHPYGVGAFVLAAVNEHHARA